ncbi:MAG: CopD family protein [Thermoflexales bacterium]|nr:CopD family protein [Thermoflexales bacterium]MCS7324960.1 CopD family protein [Thermoflexales bacterium]MCX7939097.1 CopD family protein [Thermoflexales bacterium]MDW8054279.1 CopD family protein [Anaerolineae bacterium]MDW8291559.1 CopD family protein [Anaerolineae bacterium]
MEVSGVAARWLVLVALAMLASAPTCALLMARREASRALHRATHAEHAHWVNAAVGLSLLAFVLDVLVHGRWVWLVARLALLIGVWASLSRQRTALGALLVAALLLTQSFQGNAPQQREWLAAVVADWLHLVSAAVWLGGVGYLALVILPAALRDQSRLAGLAEAVSAFSSLAVAAVLVAALTGIAQSAALVGSFAALIGTTYGQALLVKLGSSAVLLALGAFHHFVVSPQLNLWRLRAAHAAEAARRFRVSLAVESAFAAFTLVAAAAMTILPAPGLG